MPANTPGRLKPYHIRASNLSRESENRIHDDSVARGLGFAGSLVPGVEIYAYACHFPVHLWGRAWLDHGVARCHFFKPVYDGRLVSISGARDSPDRLILTVTSDGIDCATIECTMEAARTPPEVGLFAERPLPADRPAANESSLAPGTWLGTVSLDATPELLTWYRRVVFETHPLYSDDAIVHPGQILRLCNQALIRNVALDVWVHKASLIRHFSVATAGEILSVRSQVTANYEHKGHRLAGLDMIVLAGGVRPIAHVAYTAIYRLRGAA
jgi:hypothetical protein